MNHARHRTPTPGPEFDLVAGALEAGLAERLASAPPTQVLIEPDIEGWFPDIVAVYSRLSDKRPRLLPSKTALRVLHEVYRARGIHIDTIAERSYLPRKQLVEAIHDLSELGFIYPVHAGVVRCRPKSEVFTATAIVAVEAKVSHWRRALDQAHRNKWFASASYVLLPAGQWTTQALYMARSTGVGAVDFDGQKIRTLHRPAPLSLPASYGSWYTALAATLWSQPDAPSQASPRRD